MNQNNRRTYQKATPFTWAVVPLLTLPGLSGNSGAGAENSSVKVRQRLKNGIFTCVHASEKHGAFTAIHGREWDNTRPFGGIFPPFTDGFRLAAFFASFGSLITEKICEAFMHSHSSRSIRCGAPSLSLLTTLAGRATVTVAFGVLLALPVFYIVEGM